MRGARLPRRLISAAAIVIGTSIAAPAHAQGPGLLSGPVTASGQVSVTNKGISTVPALTLGRPAAIFDLAVRKGALGFEPQFRFGTDGKPWSFLLWGRYRVVQGETFDLTLGGHPSFSFRTTTMPTGSGGIERDVIQVRRYAAGDVTASWALADDLSVGGYYLYSKGLDFGAPPHTHMLAARAALPAIAFTDDLVLQVAPQAYFLRTFGQNGTYLGANLTMPLPDTPLAVAAILNTPIESRVTGGQDFLWNVSLICGFR